MKWLVVSMWMLLLNAEAWAGGPPRNVLEVGSSYSDGSAGVAPSPKYRSYYSSPSPIRSRGQRQRYLPYGVSPVKVSGIEYVQTSVEGYDRQEGKRVTKYKILEDGRFVGERTVEEGYDNRQSYFSGEGSPSLPEHR